MTEPTAEESPLATGRALLHSPSTPRLEPKTVPVLIVEDDPSHRELLSEMVTSWGYEPVEVGSAEEAEFVMRRRDLGAAIVDVFLPGRSGMALLSKLRERFPEATLLGISAMSDPVMSRRCKAVGADAFLGKPVAIDNLAEALKTPHRTWH